MQTSSEQPNFFSALYIHFTRQAKYSFQRIPLWSRRSFLVWIPAHTGGQLMQILFLLNQVKQLGYSGR